MKYNRHLKVKINLFKKKKKTFYPTSYLGAKDMVKKKKKRIKRISNDIYIKINK